MGPAGKTSHLVYPMDCECTLHSTICQEIGIVVFYYIFSCFPEMDCFLAIITSRAEDVLSDDVCKWACGPSWEFASTNHHAHSRYSYAHTKELSWHRLNLQFRGI